MKVLLLAAAFMTLLAPPRGAVTVNVNAKNGDVVMGNKTFRVTVNSDNPVTQVEFYVGSELRGSDQSTPYEFTIDGLAEKDGDLKLRFKAYTTEGQTGETTITVKVDNGVSKGAQYHIDQGTAALQDSRWDDAITSGRIALRADPNSNAARMILARAYLAKGDTAQAQKFAEDITSNDPKNAAAKDLLAAISLRAAFKMSTATGGKASESLAAMSDAFKSAIGSRVEVLEANLDAVGAPTSANAARYADAAIRLGRLGAALDALKPAFEADQKNAGLANRISLIYLRQGKPAEAATTFSALKKAGVPDAYSFSLQAIALAELSDPTGSDNMIQEAILADSEDPSVLAAQSFIALKFIRSKGVAVKFNLNYDDVSAGDPAARQESRQTLQKLLTQMSKVSVARPETYYYQEALGNLLAQYSQGQKAFELGVLAEPANPDAFIEMGNQAMRSIMVTGISADDKSRALESAKVMFNAALVADPTSAQALAGLSLAYSVEGKVDDAVRWGEAAIKANPDFAPAHVALASAYSTAAVAYSQSASAVRNARGDNAEQKARDIEAKSTEFAEGARREFNIAGKLDPRTTGQDVSKAATAWRYCWVGGRLPVLPLPRS